MAVYQGSSVRALGGRLLPSYYLAIRDPSSVKVKAVDQPNRSDEVRYVSLIFERDRQISPKEAAARLDGHPSNDAAFVVTVSLPIAKEEQFVRDVLPDGPEEWTDLFDRLCSIGHRGV